LIRTVPIPHRLGQTEVTSGAIVTAVDADTGEPLPDFIAGNSGPIFTSANTPAPAGAALFTSPNAYASGTGLGPINLPSVIPASLASYLPSVSTLLLIGVAIAALWLISEHNQR
jgi:hypothetical protein